MSKTYMRLAYSFRNRMIIIFFAIIIVPFLLFAYYAHIKSIEGISNANSTFSMSYLQQAKTNFEAYLHELNDQINALIGNKDLQQALEQLPGTTVHEEDFTVSMVSTLYKNTPLIDALRVRVYPLDPSRYPTYMSTIGESDQLGREDWFIQSKMETLPRWHLFMPQKGRYARPLLSYIKRFSGLYDQKARGIIVADLSENQLQRFFTPSEKMKGQKFLVLDDKGEVLYDSSNNAWTGSPIPSDSFPAWTGQAAEGSKTIDIGGDAHLVTYVRMDSEPWLIVSLTPLHTLIGPINELNRLLVLFLVVYL
ncbi:cache domain-containing protein, partial [Paenibacillus sepulcri]|nr:cache domain-containing protein [Paenibacillus sepulcri]